MLTNCNLLLESISDGILMLDKDGIIKYSNPATTTLTGFSAEQLLNQSIAICYANEERKSLRISYELDVAAKRGKFVSEGWRSFQGSTPFWGELVFTPAYDEKGVLTGFACTLKNTSEKKKAELDTIQREEQFRLMVEGVQDYGIFMLDPKGHIVTWNDGARKIKGYHANEIIGKHFSTFYTREDLEIRKPERELEIAKETGKYEEEGWRVRKNGSVFWANVVITSLYNEQNKLIGFSKVTRDLTERRVNEENLRQSEERYRLLVEQVLDYGIFMLDEKGRIVSWNEGARRINGYTEDEILGKYFSIFYSEEDILNHKPAYELKIARETGKYEEEGWRIKKDGTKFWASVVITAIYSLTDTNNLYKTSLINRMAASEAGIINKNSKVLMGYSKVTRDLTERKEAERALRESYEEYKILSSKLKLANDELAYANQELEQFTSIVSHDLQEPVRTVKSFLQLIDMKVAETGNQELKTFINKAVTATNRMKELIQNLLHYSQLSKDEVVEDEINVSELFNEVIQNLKGTIEAVNAKIEIENNVKTVRGDKVQLMQLVQNLVSNALKFTDQRQPNIKLKCIQKNGQPEFSISDNGIGMAKADLGKIFEIFRRLHTQKKYPGTGIGLAICKKIVDRHKGKIWLESEPGKGTTFYFTLHSENKAVQPV
jgi:PAS domain S-box-containing protein